MFKGCVIQFYCQDLRIPNDDLQYLDEFSRALATEVRMLLSEVGKLREERRTLQL